MNILTFDIEDWYVINDTSWIHHSRWDTLEQRIGNNLRIILDLLSRHQQPATFFILGWVAEKYPEMVKEISGHGHEIGYHSFYHVRINKLSPEAFKEDLYKGIELLQNITGKPVISYRAPNFLVKADTLWVYPIMAEAGIKASSSVKSIKGFQHADGDPIPSRAYPFMVKTVNGHVLEMPLNRINTEIFGLPYTGSGYFRLLPVSVVNFLMGWQDYNMIYFHPRDFDKNPVQHKDLSFMRNWLNRVNTSGTAAKLDKLLGKHSFLSVSGAEDVYSSMNLKEIVVKG